MFLLVPAHPGFPGQIPQSRKTVVCVCVLHQIVQAERSQMKRTCMCINTLVLWPFFMSTNAGGTQSRILYKELAQVSCTRNLHQILMQVS